MARREVKIPYGKAWVEDGDVPATLLFNPDNYSSFTSQMAHRSDRSRMSRAFVSFVRQSGGEFVAICGGCFRPAEQGFSCRVAFRDNYSPGEYGILEHEASCILQGVKLLGQYDTGTLEIDESANHPADSKRWAWERAGAVLIRLVQSDVWELDDSELTQVIWETAKYGPPVG
ncbi:hypothetical protein NDI45_25305 [Leptolyngbya sp. GB1-A1]|uniref:hypothetical protein n=1 Tax=Leptolyngbya sp. GB1-A1 TaxID=2933908 RepID=UPI003298055D